jgi:hypothetical protein
MPIHRFAATGVIRRRKTAAANSVLVVDLLLEEGETMRRAQVEATWVAFMLTALRRRLGMSVSEFALWAQQRGVIRFLFENYELLHYYGNEDVVDDTLRYVADAEERHAGTAA